MSDRVELLRQAIADDDARSAAYVAQRQLDTDDIQGLGAQFGTFLGTELMPSLQGIAAEFEAAGRRFQIARLESDQTCRRLLLTLDRPGRERDPLRLRLTTAISPEGEITADLERLQGAESAGKMAITPGTGAGIADFIIDTYIMALTRPDDVE